MIEIKKNLLTKNLKKNFLFKKSQKIKEDKNMYISQNTKGL